LPHLLRLAVLLLLVPSLASAEEAWRGDFETGNISQWTRSQSVANSRLQVVSDVVREGRYALKATVRQGDDPIGASGNRNELLYISEEKTGSTWFYKWSTLFPKNYPSADSWQVIIQWHQEGCCGSPPLEIFVKGEEMNLRVGGADGDVVWQGALNRGNWHDFILEVKWSANPKTGYVKLWHNGQNVLPKTHGATQYGRETNYLKLGLYRDDSIRPEASVYHDGFVMASKLEDVLPPPPAPAPEPTPPVVVAEPTPVPDLPGLPDVPAPSLPEEQLPGTETPTAGTQPGLGALPSEDMPGPGSSGMPGDRDLGAQGCGASATGTAGAPIAAAAGLLALGAVLGRRRKAAEVRVRARRRR
jgi:uncharacterized protein (TIGR03382 family)